MQIFGVDFSELSAFSRKNGVLFVLLQLGLVTGFTQNLSLKMGTPFHRSNLDVKSFGGRSIWEPRSPIPLSPLVSLREEGGIFLEVYPGLRYVTRFGVSEAGRCEGQEIKRVCQEITGPGGSGLVPTTSHL